MWGKILDILTIIFRFVLLGAGILVSIIIILQTTGHLMYGAVEDEYYSYGDKSAKNIEYFDEVLVQRTQDLYCILNVETNKILSYDTVCNTFRDIDISNRTEYDVVVFNAQELKNFNIDTVEEYMAVELKYCLVTESDSIDTAMPLDSISKFSIVGKEW